MRQGSARPKRGGCPKNRHTKTMGWTRSQLCEPLEWGARPRFLKNQPRESDRRACGHADRTPRSAFVARVSDPSACYSAISANRPESNSFTNIQDNESLAHMPKIILPATRILSASRLLILTSSRDSSMNTSNDLISSRKIPSGQWSVQTMGNPVSDFSGSHNAGSPFLTFPARSKAAPTI